MSASLTVFLKVVKEAKPHIKESTQITYAEKLRAIYHNMWGKPENGVYDLTNFDNVPEIMAAMENLNAVSKKHWLCGLLCYKRYPEFEELMKIATQQSNKIQKDNVLTPKLIEQTITDEDIEEHRETLMNYWKLHMNNNTPNSTELQEMQQSLIFALYFTEGLPPRRSMDYYAMKMSNADKDNDNFIDWTKKQFVFNKYKTAWKFGQQIIDIPNSLFEMLIIWRLRVPIEVDNLLFTISFLGLNASTMAERIQRIFGKGKSVNSIRHWYLTKNFKQVYADFQHMEDTMNKMGSSTGVAGWYIKLNEDDD